MLVKHSQLAFALLSAYLQGTLKFVHRLHLSGGSKASTLGQTSKQAREECIFLHQPYWSISKVKRDDCFSLEGINFGIKKGENQIDSFDSLVIHFLQFQSHSSILAMGCCCVAGDSGISYGFGVELNLLFGYSFIH